MKERTEAKESPQDVPASSKSKKEKKSKLSEPKASTPLLPAPTKMASTSKAKPSKSTPPAKTQKSKKSLLSTVASHSKAEDSDPASENDGGEDDEDNNENDAESDGENGSDSSVLLHGFSSESDSSDEDEDVDGPALDVGKLPTVAKDDASVKRKLEKAKKQPVSKCIRLIALSNKSND